MSLALAIVPTLLAAAPPAGDGSAALMAGKVDTGRAIVLEATLDAPPAAVFALWTTEEGLRRFFAPKAVIDPRPGGRYEIVFAPELDPEGDSAGTKGARILRFEPGRALSFEWHSFQRHALAGVPPGASGPPFAPEERDRRPLPSWVDLTFEPVAGEPGKTHLVLAHRGFEASERWEEARRYFWTAWASVLGRLGAACAAPESVAAIP